MPEQRRLTGYEHPLAWPASIEPGWAKRLDMTGMLRTRLSFKWEPYESLNHGRFMAAMKSTPPSVRVTVRLILARLSSRK